MLSGGGARGAYEAGVLRYLLDELPARIGGPVRLDVASGTSVGAIHACHVAAYAGEASGRGERLARVWREMRLGDVAALGADAVRVPLRLLGFLRSRIGADGGELPERLHGLLDTTALEGIVRRQIHWPSIGRNLRAGLLEAVCVAATEIATGRVVVFVETRDLRALPWAPEAGIAAQPTRLRPVHALASAAIPVLFPAVRVGERYYADGGLRLNTPLAPALRLGADRVLVVALRRDPAAAAAASPDGAGPGVYANPVFLYGKVLNALLLDHVDGDIAQLRAINALLAGGEAVCGPEFVERVNGALPGARGHGFRRVEDLVLRPSEDLGRLAGDVLARPATDRSIPRWVRLLLRALGLRGGPLEADLLSYLLFDRTYTASLVELGYQDAKRREDELARFFAD